MTTPVLPIKDRDPAWEPGRWHAVNADREIPTFVYRVTRDGIFVQGEPSERRTKGEPSTLRRIHDEYGDLILHACSILEKHYGALGAPCNGLAPPPDVLVAGMIGAESKGLRAAERGEAHLGDVSIGLTQTLTATAHDLARRVAPVVQSALGIGSAADEKTLPQGGNVDRWRAILTNPQCAISLGALYLKLANQRQDLKYDPVLCYSAYNAGSARASATTPWGVHYYRKQLPDGRWADAMNNFAAWYGDACAVWHTK
jgi:hypothetical protein